MAAATKQEASTREVVDTGARGISRMRFMLLATWLMGHGSALPSSISSTQRDADAISPPSSTASKRTA